MVKARRAVRGTMTSLLRRFGNLTSNCLVLIDSAGIVSNHYTLPNSLHA